MFTLSDMRSLLTAKPFAPFQLVLSDGRTVPVLSPEVVAAARRFAVVVLLDPAAVDTPADRWITVYYMHVTAVEMLQAGAPPFSAPPPAGPSESPAGSPA
jgi:hypothetical protein